MRGLLTASALALAPFLAGCTVVGGVAGATIGALSDPENPVRGARNGALIGAGVGLAMDVYARHRNEINAAREDELETRAEQLQRRAQRLERYNLDLEERVATLRQQLQQARSQYYYQRQQLNDLRAQLATEQRRASAQLGDVRAALTSVEYRQRRLSRRDDEYSEKYGALERQRRALFGAEARLSEILSMSV